MFGSKKKSDDEGEGENEEKEEEEAQDKKGSDKKAGGVGEMKHGDYMVHIFVEKAKDIKVPENSTVDPII